MTINLDALNSATKYPSIPTYHRLDPRNGTLIDGDVIPFPKDEMLVIAEKVDGTNGRIIVLPDGSYYLGSREELFYASGDQIQRQDLGIVPTLKRIADLIADDHCEEIMTYYLEVYGGGGKHRVGQNARQYTGTGKYGARLFDITSLDPEVLEWTPEFLSGWRERGGQYFYSAQELSKTSHWEKVIPLVPEVAGIRLKGGDLPTSTEDMEAMLGDLLPDGTMAGLDDAAGGKAEGVVVRTKDRSLIAKIRFEDYQRTRRARLRDSQVHAERQGR